VTQIKYKYVGVYPYASQLNVCNSLGENWMPLIVHENINTNIASRFFLSPLAKYQGKNVNGDIILPITDRKDLPSGCIGHSAYSYFYVSPSKIMTGQLNPSDFRVEFDDCRSPRVDTFCALRPNN